MSNGAKKTLGRKCGQYEGTIVGETNLKVFTTEYYKKLFKAPDPNTFTKIVEYNDSDVENGISTAEFTENEILEAISQRKHNKAPGPDSFPA